MRVGLAKTLTELEKMTDEELKDGHYQAAQNTVVGVNYHLEELRVREMAGYARRMDLLTKCIGGMTLVVTVATILNLLLFFLSS